MARFGFDAVIFGLQKFGGISTYSWEMLWRLARDATEQLTITMPERQLGSRCKEILALPVRHERERVPTAVARYLPCASSDEVMLSTYYRRAVGRRTRLVVPVYDFVYERYRAQLPLAIHRWQKRAACQAAEAILCISHSTRNDLLEEYSEIDPAKVLVVHLAVDHERFFQDGDLDPSLAESILFVGQRAGYKRFDLAVEAARAVGRPLAVVGPALSSAERAYLDQRLNGRWRLEPAPDDKALRRIYSSVFALLYPSDYEGFGLPLLEAQACGCPTIAANTSSLPEVGGAATLFAADQRVDDYADAASRLASESRRQSTICAGLENAARFQWERTYSETFSVISALAAA